jgi:DNA invertase Pin-like site-specific DNA recombinase
MTHSLAVQPLSRRLRAVKVIRVSKKGKRTAERFISPEDQDNEIERLARGQNWIFVASFTELNQSGLRTKLVKRRGLYPALQMVEAGEADVVVFGYRDRMARNNLVEEEFLARVALAGGQAWAADMGQIKTDTAVERLQSGLLGIIQKYVAETTADKTAGPKARAVEMGIAPYPNLPVGYRRHCDINKDSQDRHIVVYEPERPLVVGAYERREEGWTLADIRDWLRENGIVLQIRGVQELLKSRFYLGELRFGKLVNLKSHPAIVEPAMWRRVQKLRAARGPRRPESASVRLLARQGIVRCAHCHRAMIVGSQTKKDGTKYYDYRCQSMGDCTSRVAISADVLEREVITYIKGLQLTGRGSLDDRLVKAEAAVASTQQDLNQAIVNLAVVKNSTVAQETLAALNTAHEQAKEYLQDLLSALGASQTALLAADWDKATLAEQRRWLRIVFDRVEISRGRGPARIQPFLK